MADTELPIRIETREDLLYLLAEAAEIEHNLMCCYLYAGFSLKDPSTPGLSPDEAQAVGRWRAAIRDVAIDEMVHLALVANMTMALGAAPVQPGYHPSGIVVALAPFDRATLDHFIYLERPDGVALPDGAGFAPARPYVRFRTSDRLMPNAQDYETVGELYRAIREGFGALSAKLGEAALFCGDPAGQVGPPDVELPGLSLVTDLASARTAVDTIVTQGEGAPGHHVDGHYARFLAIRAEFERLTEANADFVPAWPAARNPVMRPPIDPTDRVYIDEPHIAAVHDLANALYGHMLRCLASAYGRRDEDGAMRRLLIDTAIGLMGLLSRTAGYLASLPAGPAHPRVHAGMSFAMLRDVSRLPQGPGERRVLGERIVAMSEAARRIFDEGHALAAIGGQLTELAAPFSAVR
jgi:hypothetical protein